MPVLDREGRLKGVLSMNDLARHAHRSGGRESNGLGDENVVRTLAAICEPPSATRGRESTAKPRPGQLSV